LKAVIWPYRFDDMKLTWQKQMIWLVNSLIKYGVEVKPHVKFKCKGIENLNKYNPSIDHNAEICIYNHTDESYIIGNVLPTKKNWFFKPTVPDKFYTTLDELGYGPFSSITYIKPDFENVNIGNFFETKVKNWIDNKISKWGNKLNKEEKIEESDFYLVIGQCGGDSVVTHFDFGSYFTKLEQVVIELVRIGNKKIIVKLHPDTDGVEGTAGSFKNNEFSLKLQKRLESLSSKVKVYIGKINIHNFIEKSYCVILANSGAGIEAMMHHKPIIAWGFPDYHWVTYDLRHLAELNEALKLKWFDQEKQDKFLYWYLEDYCFYNQETCDKRVKELLADIV